MTPQEIDTALAEIGVRLEARRIWMIVWTPSESQFHPQHLYGKDFFSSEQEANIYFRKYELSEGYHVVSYVPEADQPTLLAIIKQLRATDNNEH